jgi:hypothetical protein
MGYTVYEWYKKEGPEKKLRLISRYIMHLPEGKENHNIPRTGVPLSDSSWIKLDIRHIIYH